MKMETACSINDPFSDALKIALILLDVLLTAWANGSFVAEVLNEGVGAFEVESEFVALFVGALGVVS